LQPLGIEEAEAKTEPESEAVMVAEPKSVAESKRAAQAQKTTVTAEAAEISAAELAGGRECGEIDDQSRN
jgi:hypothetical protein